MRQRQSRAPGVVVNAAACRAGDWGSFPLAVSGYQENKMLLPSHAMEMHETFPWSLVHINIVTNLWDREVAHINSEDHKCILSDLYHHPSCPSSACMYINVA